MTDRPEALSQQILRQIGSEANRRFLRNLPIFSRDKEVPSRLLDLLSRLDAAESRALAAGGGRRR